MPKKSTRKGLCQKKNKGRKTTNEREKYANDKQNYNKKSPDDSRKMAAHMTSQPLKDFVVDIPSQNTSVSGLTSSVNSNNSNDTRYATSAAKIMVESLEMLKSSELQKKALSTVLIIFFQQFYELQKRRFLNQLKF